MTILDWVTCFFVVGLCIATVIMTVIGIRLIYKMTMERSEKENPILKGTEAEFKALDSRGLRIGIYVAEKDRLEQAYILARRISATHLAFDNPNVKLLKVVETCSGCIYDFSDGVRIEVLVARESARGKRFNYLYIDKAISDNCILQVLLPQVIPNTDVFEEIINGGWEFFDANSVEQNKAEWRDA